MVSRGDRVLLFFIEMSSKYTALNIKKSFHRPDFFLYWKKKKTSRTFKKEPYREGIKKKKTLICSAQKELSSNSQVDLQTATDKTVPNSLSVGAAFFSVKN